MKIVDWVKGLLTKPIVTKWVGSAVRHGMTLLAGAFVAIGLPEVASGLESIAPEVSGMVVAGVLYLLAQGWSFKAKTKEK